MSEPALPACFDRLHRRLAPGESFSQTVVAGTEAVVFVWKGPVEVLIQGKPQQVGERDAVFVQGPAGLELRNVSRGQAILIHAIAPPGGVAK